MSSAYQRILRFFEERFMLAGYFFIIEPKSMMMSDEAITAIFESTVRNFMVELTKLKTKAHMITNGGSMPIFFRDAPLLCIYLNHAVKTFFLICLLHTTCLYQRRGENASAEDGVPVATEKF